MKSKIIQALKWVWGLFSHNVGLKIVSLVFAILLWSYVIYANPNLTRTKVLSGIEVTTSGQQVLSSRGYALLTDISEEVTPVRVRVEVPQSNYAEVTAENVRIELDLSSVRQTGKAQVSLRGSSTYGKVTQIWPEYIDLVVEELDTRQVPIAVNLRNTDDEHYYYRVRSTNPTLISVSGPGSVVQSVASALVEVDMKDIVSNHRRSEQFTLLDGSDAKISPATLSSSYNSATVDIEVSPMKKLPIQADIDEVITGELATGYEIDSITLQPDTISVAGEQALLDAVHELVIESVDISGAKSSVTSVRTIHGLEDFTYTSATQVSVTVNIREVQTTQRYTDIAVNLSNKTDNKVIDLAVPKIEVRVTGPYTIMQDISAKDIVATVDVANLTLGEHSLPVKVTVYNHPDLNFETDPEKLLVTVSESE